MYEEDPLKPADPPPPRGFGTGIKGAVLRRVAGLSFCAFPGMQRRAMEEAELEQAAAQDQRMQHLESVQAALRALQIQADVLQKEVDTHMDRAARAEEMGLAAMRQGNAVQQRVHVRNSVSQRNLAAQKSSRMAQLQERMQGAELAVSSAQNAELAASLDVATATAVSGMHGNIFSEDAEDRTHDALTDLEDIRDNEHSDMATRWTEASGYETCGESEVEALMRAQQAMAAAEIDCPVPAIPRADPAVVAVHALPAAPNPQQQPQGKRPAMRSLFRT